jgi:hypothetical protein
MRKYLLGIIAVVIAITLNSFSVQTKAKSTDPLFHWFTTTGGNTFTEDTIENEADATDCTGASDVCEYGYDDEEDFVDGDPANGLAPGAEPDAEIREVP